MRIVETPDGTVKVVELDPTKKYVLIADRAVAGLWTDTGRLPRLTDGEIILKDPGDQITFVENPEAVDRIATRPPAEPSGNAHVRE